MPSNILDTEAAGAGNWIQCLHPSSRGDKKQETKYLSAKRKKQSSDGIVSDYGTLRFGLNKHHKHVIR